MRVIHINKSDTRGGAARFLLALHEGLLKQNIASLILVDQKYSSLNEVISLDNDQHRSVWFKVFNKLAKVFLARKARGTWTLFKIFRAISLPLREIYKVLGIDYFNYPGLRSKLPQLVEGTDTIIQLYAAHGNYLDLPYLRNMSKKNVVVFRMPDAWLLSGHCAHSFECEKWKTGCGACPDLSIPPKINRDATAFNWRIKAELYGESSFHIVTPSHWLMNKVKQSMLMKGAASLNVIPNGVDTDTFSPGVQFKSREILKIDPEATVLLFSANGIKKNRWKDFGQLREVLNRLAEIKVEKKIEFIGLGESAEDEEVGSIKVRYVKYQQNKDVLVNYYRSSDLYIHPTRADSFPNSVLEALSCGIPVIANGVGGIPEQIKSLSMDKISGQRSMASHTEEATGVLVPERDSNAFFNAVKYLIENTQVRIQLGKNARRDACLRFSQQRVTDDYVKLYHQLSIKHKQVTL